MPLGASDLERFQPVPCTRLRQKTQVGFPRNTESMQMVRDWLGQLEATLLDSAPGQDEESEPPEQDRAQDEENDRDDFFEESWANGGLDQPFYPSMDQIVYFAH